MRHCTIRICYYYCRCACACLSVAGRTVQCEAYRLELVVRGALCACVLSGAYVEIELAAQRVVPYARHLLKGLIILRPPVRGRQIVVHLCKHFHNVVALRWQSRMLIDLFAELFNVP